MSGCARFLLATTLAAILAMFVSMNPMIDPDRRPVLYVTNAFLAVCIAACFGGIVARFAGRIVGVVVLAACLGYLYTELFQPPPGPRDHGSAFGAIMASIAYGVPALGYRLTGRFWTIPGVRNHDAIDHLGADDTARDRPPGDGVPDVQCDGWDEDCDDASDPRRTQRDISD